MCKVVATEGDCAVVPVEVMGGIPPLAQFTAGGSCGGNKDDTGAETTDADTGSDADADENPYADASARKLGWKKLCPSWAPAWLCTPGGGGGSDKKKPQCPVVRPVAGFDVDRYIARSWYVQKQQTNGYQRAEDLFCVTATYSKRGGKSDKSDSDSNSENIGSSGLGSYFGGGGSSDDDDGSSSSAGLLQVENRANVGEVNGALKGAEGSKRGGGGGGGLLGGLGLGGLGSFSSLSSLCAQQIDPAARTGELAVQPCFLFGLTGARTAGPYWVIAVDEEEYSWAVVSGGQPTEVVVAEAADGGAYSGGSSSSSKLSSSGGSSSGGVKCTTKSSGINGSGLWLFTRDPVPAAGVVEAMEARLEAMGVATGRLLPVAQAGCTYEGMPLKK